MTATSALLPWLASTTGPSAPVAPGPVRGAYTAAKVAVPSAPHTFSLRYTNRRPWLVSMAWDNDTLRPGVPLTVTRAPVTTSNTLILLTSHASPSRGSGVLASYTRRRPSTGSKSKGAVPANEPSAKNSRTLTSENASSVGV